MLNKNEASEVIVAKLGVGFKEKFGIGHEQLKEILKAIFESVPFIPEELLLEIAETNLREDSRSFSLEHALRSKYITEAIAEILNVWHTGQTYGYKGRGESLNSPGVDLELVRRHLPVCSQ